MKMINPIYDDEQNEKKEQSLTSQADEVKVPSEILSLQSYFISSLLTFE